MANKRPTIGIIGGTGEKPTFHQSSMPISGLARRWSVAGYTLGLGSRSKDKAEAAAGKLGASVRGANNVGAARAGDIVVIAVPYPNHAASLPLQSSLMSKTYLKSDHFKHDDVTHRDGHGAAEIKSLEIEPESSGRVALRCSQCRRAPHPRPDARLRADTRGRHGGVREELAAGIRRYGYSYSASAKFPNRGQGYPAQQRRESYRIDSASQRALAR
jgi:NADP oxidoreductase coenzyme F420-dependent